ncbi:MAG: DNA translocase FtsK [Bacillota bacterium]
MSRRSKKKENMKSPLYKEIISLIIIAIGILILISLQSESTGELGKLVKYVLMGLLSTTSVVLPYLIILFGIFSLAGKVIFLEKKAGISLVFIYVGYIMLNSIYHIDYIPESVLNFHNLVLVFNQGVEGLGGGLLGTFLAYWSLKFVGIYGSYILIITMMIVSFILLTGISIVRLLNSSKNGIFQFLASLKQAFIEFIHMPRVTKTKEPKPAVNKNVTIHGINESAPTKAEQLDDKIKILDFTRNSDSQENEISSNYEKKSSITKTSSNSAEEDNIEIMDKHIKSNHVSSDEYKLPELDLLENANTTGTNKNDKKEIIQKAKTLEETLLNFGVEAKVTQVSKGPAITRYELQPSPGVKISKIVGLSNDIALNLAASTIRIEAPIPGKAAVGIEIPNENVTMVNLREVLESDKFVDEESKLTFVLGKDIAGHPITADLKKMPHLLIAGATGSGKSVCVNTLITSILYKAKPNEVKFLLIDPKVVELNNYNGIPHLLIPVVTDPKKASTALNWAVQEMTNRYKAFAHHGVRDMSSYNDKMIRDEGETFPHIVVIIDELADLMMVAPGQVEDSICRLAQMARAAGIHLIVATQRPSVDVITGVIKANIPSRIAFAVSSQADSRTILDMGGAEKLLGKGDMLFYPVGASKPKRVQGAFISDAEVERVISYIKEQSIENAYEEDIIDKIDSEFTSDDESTDELLKDAIELVVQTEQASISMLQRRFRIGYNRAARLIDAMEERGIVGEHEGSKPRQVLVSKEDFEEMKSRI